MLKKLYQKKNKKIEQYGNHKETKSILVTFLEKVCQIFQHKGILAHPI